ncbi:hypothetical protein AU191_16850 [Mycolicibacterium acapulense]|nr:hypothetical protein AU191_16850 [Mycolicibacterium acapulense]
MTDARLPERWLNDRRLQRLSPEHYRAYVNTLLWSVANRTDGRIEQEDLGLIPHWSANAAKAFVDAGLFTPQPRGWLLTDYAATQTSRDELATLEDLRARERQKKARQRAKAKAALEGGAESKALSDAEAETASEEERPRDGPRDMSPGTAQEGRTGQAGRPGQGGDQSTNEHDSPDATTNGHSADAVEWPAWRGSGPNPFEEYA